MHLRQAPHGWLAAADRRLLRQTADFAFAAGNRLQFDRDHTTVMHAVRKVEELIVEDQSLAENVDSLRCSLKPDQELSNKAKAGLKTGFCRNGKKIPNDN